MSEEASLPPDYNVTFSIPEMVHSLRTILKRFQLDIALLFMLHMYLIFVHGSTMTFSIGTFSRQAAAFPIFFVFYMLHIIAASHLGRIFLLLRQIDDEVKAAYSSHAYQDVEDYQAVDYVRALHFSTPAINFTLMDNFVSDFLISGKRRVPGLCRLRILLGILTISACLGTWFVFRQIVEDWLVDSYFALVILCVLIPLTLAMIWRSYFVKIPEQAYYFLNIKYHRDFFKSFYLMHSEIRRILERKDFPKIAESYLLKTEETLLGTMPIMTGKATNVDRNLSKDLINKAMLRVQQRFEGLRSLNNQYQASFNFIYERSIYINLYDYPERCANCIEPARKFAEFLLANCEFKLFPPEEELGELETNLKNKFYDEVASMNMHDVFMLNDRGEERNSDYAGRFALQCRKMLIDLEAYERKATKAELRDFFGENVAATR